MHHLGQKVGKHFLYYGSSGTSETFRNIKLSSNSITVGEGITVINLDTGDELVTLKVKSIGYV